MKNNLLTSIVIGFIVISSSSDQKYKIFNETNNKSYSRIKGGMLFEFG